MPCGVGRGDGAAKRGDLCNFKTSLEGKQDLTINDYARRDGVASWDENQTAVETCAGWPSMTTHGFGLNEVTTGIPRSYGFCVATDADGDAIVWKILPKNPDSQEPSPDEVLMASGKYAGITAKESVSCKFEGSPEIYKGTCEIEMTYKLP